MSLREALRLVLKGSTPFKNKKSSDIYLSEPASVHRYKVSPAVALRLSVPLPVFIRAVIFLLQYVPFVFAVAGAFYFHFY